MAAAGRVRPLAAPAVPLPRSLLWKAFVRALPAGYIVLEFPTAGSDPFVNVPTGATSGGY